MPDMRIHDTVSAEIWDVCCERCRHPRSHHYVEGISQKASKCKCGLCDSFSPRTVYQAWEDDETPEEINEIRVDPGLGMCSQCRRDIGHRVIIGEVHDLEGKTATLCENCLRDAIAVLEAHSWAILHESGK